MTTEQAVVVPVDQMDDAALQREKAELIEEIQGLDSDLATNKNAFHRRAMKPQDWFDWRAKAVEAKSWRTRRLVLINAEINQRFQGSLDERRADGQKTHRRKAHRLRMALEMVEQMLSVKQYDEALSLVRRTRLEDLNDN